MAINIAVETAGVQGPTGPSMDTNNLVTVSNSSGYFYQIENEQKYKILIPTGIESVQISFNPQFESVPIVHSNVSISDDTIYVSCTKGISTTGCYIYFSDIIQETGMYLHVLIKTPINYYDLSSW